MRVIVLTPPIPVVSYEEAVDRLKLAGGPAEQTDVEAMIAAATAMFDGLTGWLGRAIGEQTLQLRCDRFTDRRGRPIVLPYPPIIEVLGVEYIDSDGAEQALPIGEYELIGAELLAAAGKSLPGTLDRREAVRIDYLAGYETVPETIRAAILLAVGDMYRFRQTIATTTVEQLPSAASINRLVGPLRVFR